jgi:Flp pilus assembly protein TadG
MKRTARKCRFKGQTLVEFALVMPVALLLLVGAVDFGRFVTSHSEAAGLCQDAARYGRQTDPDTGNMRTVQSVKERVWSTLPSGVTSSDVESLDIALSTSVAGMAATKVSIVYKIQCLMPLSNQFFENGIMRIRGSGVFVRDSQN